MRRLKQRLKGGIFSKESEVILPNAKLVDGKLSTYFGTHPHPYHPCHGLFCLPTFDLYGKLVDLNVPGTPWVLPFQSGFKKARN